MPADRGLYIALLSVHGLVRGHEPELGKDADTGGQIRYVVDLARALAAHPGVERVDLITRQVLALNVDADYARPVEGLGDGAFIVRLPFGPHRYLKKESLWRWLPALTDHALRHFRQVGRVPDVVHGHYADGGEAALRLTRLLNVPLVFTGHSLGRVKRARLAERAMSQETMEKRYRISRRIAAEEHTIAAADLIVASTEQEVEEQYGLYSVEPRRIEVIPPGVQLDDFRPPRRGEPRPAIARAVERFLREPKKPWILAVQRADERKNLAALLEAYGTDAELQEAANLVLLIGARDNLAEAPKAQRRVYGEMLELIDRYDLYGRVAYPKRHRPEDVPEAYRWAARLHGVFVNPALTEPFGLTLLEAAASGLPVVATNDGGPQSILGLCHNGHLVDPLDPPAIAAALRSVVMSRREWRRLSKAGLRGVERHFSWSGHADNYLTAVDRVRRRFHRRADPNPHARLLLADRLLVCDIDDTLIGDDAALAELLAALEAQRPGVAFGIATGRTLDSALEILEASGVPRPEVLITGVGSEIHYGEGRPVADPRWRHTIDEGWDREAVAAALEDLPGLELQPEADQRPRKLSYYLDPDDPPGRRAIQARLRERGLEARVIISHDAYLDLLPRRAGKGAAVTHVACRWGLSLENILVAGDSGNDRGMLTCGARAVVVGNHRSELESLRGADGVYFASRPCAGGVLEGIEHFGLWSDELQARTEEDR